MCPNAGEVCPGFVCALINPEADAVHRGQDLDPQSIWVSDHTSASPSSGETPTGECQCSCERLQAPQQYSGATYVLRSHSDVAASDIAHAEAENVESQPTPSDPLSQFVPIRENVDFNDGWEYRAMQRNDVRPEWFTDMQNLPTQSEKVMGSDIQSVNINTLTSTQKQQMIGVLIHQLTTDAPANCYFLRPNHAPYLSSHGLELNRRVLVLCPRVETQVDTTQGHRVRRTVRRMGDGFWMERDPAGNYWTPIRTVGVEADGRQISYEEDESGFGYNQVKWRLNEASIRKILRGEEVYDDPPRALQPPGTLAVTLVCSDPAQEPGCIRTHAFHSARRLFRPIENNRAQSFLSSLTSEQRDRILTAKEQSQAAKLSENPGQWWLPLQNALHAVIEERLRERWNSESGLDIYLHVHRVDLKRRNKLAALGRLLESNGGASLDFTSKAKFIALNEELLILAEQAAKIPYLRSRQDTETGDLFARLIRENRIRLQAACQQWVDIAKDSTRSLSDREGAIGNLLSAVMRLHLVKKRFRVLAIKEALGNRDILSHPDAQLKASLTCSTPASIEPSAQYLSDFCLTPSDLNRLVLELKDDLSFQRGTESLDVWVGGIQKTQLMDLTYAVELQNRIDAMSSRSNLTSDEKKRMLFAQTEVTRVLNQHPLLGVGIGANWFESAFGNTFGLFTITKDYFSNKDSQQGYRYQVGIANGPNAPIPLGERIFGSRRINGHYRIEPEWSENVAWVGGSSSGNLQLIKVDHARFFVDAYPKFVDEVEKSQCEAMHGTHESSDFTNNPINRSIVLSSFPELAGVAENLRLLDIQDFWRHTGRGFAELGKGLGDVACLAGAIAALPQPQFFPVVAAVCLPVGIVMSTEEFQAYGQHLQELSRYASSVDEGSVGSIEAYNEAQYRWRSLGMGIMMAAFSALDAGYLISTATTALRAARSTVQITARDAAQTGRRVASVSRESGNFSREVPLIRRQYSAEAAERELALTRSAGSGVARETEVVEKATQATQREAATLSREYRMVEDSLTRDTRALAPGSQRETTETFNLMRERGYSPREIEDHIGSHLRSCRL